MSKSHILGWGRIFSQRQRQDRWRGQARPQTCHQTGPALRAYGEVQFGVPLHFAENERLILRQQPAGRESVSHDYLFIFLCPRFVPATSFFLRFFCYLSAHVDHLSDFRFSRRGVSAHSGYGKGRGPRCRHYRLLRCLCPDVDRGDGVGLAEVPFLKSRFTGESGT
jgi:hypothetical protein